MAWKITTRWSRIVALALAAAMAALTLASAGPAGAAGAAGHQSPSEPESPAEILRGFLRERNGEFTVAEPPGATVTKPGGLNNRGELVFKYLDAEGTQRGAVLSRGRYRPVEVPGATVTAPLGQNDRGEIVGNYLDADGASHGFLRTRRGTYTTIDHPDASGTVLDTPGTIVTNINNRGEMVGIYANDGRLVGFVRDRRGRFTTIDRPGTAATYLGDINDRGQIVGDSSQDGAEELLLGSDIDAFVLHRGDYRSVEVPGAVGTALNGINNRGEMAGTYVDSQGTSHGLLRSRSGRYTTVDHPDDTALGTALYSINDRGQTTGAYQSPIAQARQPQDPAAPTTGPLSADMGQMAPPDTPDDAGPLGVELASGPRPDSGSRGRWRPEADGSGGYIYRRGRYIPLDTVDGLVTAHVAITNRGETAGAYFRSELDPGGFVRSRSGRYTRFDVAPGPSTLPLDINDRGATVGLAGDAGTCVDPAAPCAADEVRAFLRRPNGDVTTVAVPGASLTTPFGVNDRGVVVGSYADSNRVGRAFRMHRGEVTTIVPPDAPDDPAAANVFATDVNDRGHVVGCYADDGGTYHGFRYRNGRFTRIDPPGGADVAEWATTCALGINNRGQVVGQYVDADGVLHGYLWQPGRGFETIDPPRSAPTVGPTGVRGTVAADINDRGEILLPIPGGLAKGRAVPTDG